mmetsp:Transcript_99814/g.291239  ORF Transcript_99814/g.291239 Transcript_99814/m.291239 type:complete len:106 (-) Transcript_99814:110-427(-)
MLVVIEPWFSLVWRCQSLLLAVKGGQTWESLGSCEEQCRERRPWADYFGLRSGVPGNRGTLNILEGIDGVGSLTLDFDFVAGQTGRALSVVCPNCPSGQVGAEAM